MSYEVTLDFQVGDKVYDNLTWRSATIVRVAYENGRKPGEVRTASHCVGYWVDNDYLDGARHPFEISKLT